MSARDGSTPGRNHSSGRLGVGLRAGNTAAHEMVPAETWMGSSDGFIRGRLSLSLARKKANGNMLQMLGINVIKAQQKGYKKEWSPRRKKSTGINIVYFGDH